MRTDGKRTEDTTAISEGRDGDGGLLSGCILTEGVFDSSVQGTEDISDLRGGDAQPTAAAERGQRRDPVPQFPDIQHGEANSAVDAVDV